MLVGLKGRRNAVIKIDPEGGGYVTTVTEWREGSWVPVEGGALPKRADQVEAIAFAVQWNATDLADPLRKGTS